MMPEHGRQALQLDEVVERGVLHSETTIQVGAQSNVFRTARRTRQMNGMPGHVIERSPARRAQMGLVEADPQDATPASDLGSCRVSDLPVARHDRTGIAV